MAVIPTEPGSPGSPAKPLATKPQHWVAQTAPGLREQLRHTFCSSALQNGLLGTQKTEPERVLVGQCLNSQHASCLLQNGPQVVAEVHDGFLNWLQQIFKSTTSSDPEDRAMPI